MIFQFFTRKLRNFTKIFSQFLATSLFIAYFGSHLNIQSFHFGTIEIVLTFLLVKTAHAMQLSRISPYTHTHTIRFTLTKALNQLSVIVRCCCVTLLPTQCIHSQRLTSHRHMVHAITLDGVTHTHTWTNVSVSFPYA